jgi:hypothetical protein
MIWQLLKRNINPWQIGGYALASLVGLAIVLVAVQLYRDVRSAWSADPNDASAAHTLVISRPVGLSSTITGKSPEFSQTDIDNIASEPWARRVSQFQAADYGVWAGMEIGGRSLTTALFFESVPDNFIEVDSDTWAFDSIKPFIPIVLSKDYLTLYNLGFAASGRMPMVSEGVMKTVPLSVTLSGNGHVDILPARIVGFSSWLNTIAVPQQFMDWAHLRYGSGEAQQPTRLIVDINPAMRPEAVQYMESAGYEIAGAQADDGRASYFLRLVTGIVVAIGGVITLLAIFILVLSLYLLVQKNRKSISGLLSLGYTPGQISRCYVALVAIINGLVSVLALVVAMVVCRIWAPALEAVGASPTSALPTIAVALGVMAVITLSNFMVIRRLVRSCFRAAT